MAHDFYAEAINAEVFGHVPLFEDDGDDWPMPRRRARRWAEPGKYTGILIEQIGRRWLYESQGFPYPYYGA